MTERQKQSIWWHLAMEFHQAPNMGHTATSHARECGECRRIVNVIERSKE